MTTLKLKTPDACHQLRVDAEHEFRMGAARCRLLHEGSTLLLSATAPVRWGTVELKRGRLPLHGCLKRGEAWLQWGPVHPEALPDMVGRSRPMVELAELVRRMAEVSLPVLIRGGSGTGKELVARALHQLSERREGPFVAVNGATLSATLGGSQLFGHVRGAFTGAREGRRGAMRAADGGTLFIDEVGSLCLEVQATLLRALEERRVLPVGADEEVEVDVRLVSATCEPLEEAVEAGRFRRDLHQRLAATVVRVPPLHARTEDIPLLARHLLDEHGFAHLALAAAAKAQLKVLRYPGNVRELRNLLVQAALQCRQGTITRNDISRAMTLRQGTYRPRLQGLSADLDIAQVLSDHGGNRSAAARALGVPRSTFRDWLKRAAA